MDTRSLLSGLCLLLGCGLIGCSSPQRSFGTPEAAATALREAVDGGNTSELRAIFGPKASELASGNKEQDAEDLRAFAYRLNEGTLIQMDGADKATVLVGPDRRSFAVPLEKEKGRWVFDTEAGITEMDNRRVGYNELKTIEACRELIAAEVEYHSADRNGDGILEYTRRLMSAPGTRDGLYWEAGPDEDPSPLGPVMASAATHKDENGDPIPFYGYFYRGLMRQGPNAPGGAMDYEENGKLVKGVACVVYPAEYGHTGIMTFIFSTEGTIYQRDLGEDTDKMASAIIAFDPGAGWTKVSP